MTNPRTHELVSDLVACALIEGARPTSMTASMETKNAKERVLDEIERLIDRKANADEAVKQLIAKVDRLQTALMDAVTRMDRARAILVGRDGGNWGMLDTADARAALSGERTSPSEPNGELRKCTCVVAENLGGKVLCTCQPQRT